MQKSKVPDKSYGILLKEQVSTAYEAAAEDIRNLGYTILDSGFSAAEMDEIADTFDKTHKDYVAHYGHDRLSKVDELYTVRALLTHNPQIFKKVVFNSHLLSALRLMINGKFIVNQQNGIINPPEKQYNQGAWHRDIPYQHFLSSHPLAVNALYCVDDFTIQNGATFVLPASHKSEYFPSDHYVQNNALQVPAKAGSYIILDCMVFHAGAFNGTQSARRAINNVYNIPFFKQQINLPSHISPDHFTAEELDMLGFNYIEAPSVEDYLATRAKKTSPA